MRGVDGGAPPTLSLDYRGENRDEDEQSGFGIEGGWHGDFRHLGYSASSADPMIYGNSITL